MSSSLPSLELMWGPGVIGCAVAALLYGVTIGQYVFYLRAFQSDPKVIKVIVHSLFFMDTLHMYTLIGIYWYILITCRRNDSYQCTKLLPWQMLMGVFLCYWITFIVQCFYAHRVWIISSRNWIVTGMVVITATLQIVFGMLCSNLIFHSPTGETLFSTKYSPMSALSSTLCDAVITASVFYYLRPTVSFRRRRNNYIKKIAVVFIEMGLLSLINSLMMVLLYFVQSGLAGQFLTAAPGAILSKTYVNSVLAVLNARKSVREQQFARRTIEMPTIPTIR